MNLQRTQIFVPTQKMSLNTRSTLPILVSQVVTPQIDMGPTDSFTRVEGNFSQYFNRVENTDDHQDLNHITGKFHVYSSDVNGPILDETVFHPHPLIMCCSTAYSEHYPLVLSPDDIWLLIAQGVAQHIHINSDQLRHLFISNKDEAEMKNEGKDKIEIVVMLDNYLDMTKPSDTILGKINWNGVVDEIVTKVDSYLLDNATQLLECNFTTSGSIEKTASQIVIMDAFKNYFTYKNMFKCGLPSVTLLGTLQDWQAIKSRVSQLDKYGLQFWTKALHPILDCIIETAQSPSSQPLPDHLKDFWNRIALFNTRSGSSRITGWISYFFPYDKKNNISRPLVKLEDGFLNNIRHADFGTECSEFPSGLSKAHVILENSPISGVNSLEYLAGFIGYDYDKVYQGMKPRIGWAIASKIDKNNA